MTHLLKSVYFGLYISIEAAASSKEDSQKKYHGQMNRQKKHYQRSWHVFNERPSKIAVPVINGKVTGTTGNARSDVMDSGIR